MEGMSLVREPEWSTCYPMETGRGCRHVLVDGKRVPLGADGKPNRHVCMDLVPPVLEALRMGESEVALHLARTDPNLRLDDASPLGITPLMAAVAGGHTELVQALLDRTCDVHLTDLTGRSALLHAAGAAHESLVL